MGRHPAGVSCDSYEISVAHKEYPETEVLNAVLFIADPHMAILLRRMAGESHEFSVESIVELTRAGYPVARMLGTTRPDVMLLELTDTGRDLQQATAIHEQIPDVP